MSRLHYLANLYPRINDETPREYEARLKSLALVGGYMEKCALNLHGECHADESCRCKCHEETDADEQLRARVIELLQPITCELSADNADLNETAQQIINIIRSTK